MAAGGSGIAPADGAGHDVDALARRLADLSSGSGGGLFGRGTSRAGPSRLSPAHWTEQLLSWAMADEAFKTQLFRFVDVFPALVDEADVRDHVAQYLGGPGMPPAMRLAVRASRAVPAGVTSAIARRNITRMARQFIVGDSPAGAMPRLERLWRSGRATTVDLLGEKVVTETEADGYATRVDQLVRELAERSRSWPDRPVLDADDLGGLSRASVSVKPTALASSYAPLTRADGLAQARRRLLPILRTAAAQGVSVWFDMEHYDVKDLTVELFRSLLDEPELDDLETGIVIQAYLRDSHQDLIELLRWAGGRPRPVGVRLVKGAYWDAEVIEARAEGWPVPVYESKDDTDANFERCVDLLHDNHGRVRAAFASHNLRSVAYAVASGRRRGIPDHGFEIQMLHGMADPVQAALVQLGLRLRVYAPMGELVPGMAYLVRRLLENTSNESFVRQRFVEGRALDELLQPPDPGDLDRPPPSRPIRTTRASRPSPYRPEPPREWRRREARSDFAEAVDRVELGVAVPAVIGGERVSTARTIVSVDPALPERVVATSASCGASEVDDAMAEARRACESWRRTTAGQRADVLFGAAAWMRTRRDALAALEVFEVGKPWKEADADVCEAIDFCEYYGREALRLDRGGRVDSAPGEVNELRYQAKGIGVVIAPWNFPLAIPTGMVTAALVTGNAVILKPAEQSPAVAACLVRALEAGGLPRGVLGFLPGIGEEVGPLLVGHPDTAFIVFTGSKAVGLAINQQASLTSDEQRQVRRVIAEMGGKNAFVIDRDADLDQAVPAIVHGAFGYSGQKCSASSRLIVLDEVHDRLVERVIGAARQLRLGHPSAMATQMGPVIDGEAHRRIRAHVAAVSREADVLFSRDDLPATGWFVSPTIVGGLARSSPLAGEEVFGPVLDVHRVRSFDEAIEVANDTPYALTAGVMSRSPRNIAHAATELRAGNVYINRSTTGAVVGRQPFGGYGMSGVGSKAGGPDYLMQFVDPRVVTENTLRQGFAPPSSVSPDTS